MEKNLNNNKLSKLPKEVSKLIIQGLYRIFSMEDKNYPTVSFLLITEKDDKFLLSWDGEVIRHDPNYSPVTPLKLEFPYQEMSAEFMAGFYKI